MNQITDVSVLQRALERQKKARLQAEKLLETKSQQLYTAQLQLEEAKKKLENLLQEKTSELEGVFLNIVDPYIVMDMEGIVKRMNTAAKHFLGLDCEKQVIDLKKLVLPEYREYTQQSFLQLMEVGHMKNYVAEICVADGSRRHVHINSSVIYDRNHQPVGAQGIIRDITREKEVTNLLREQRKELDIIVENSPLGIILSVEDKIIKTNKAFLKMTGFEQEEVMGRKLTDFSASLAPEEAVRLSEEMSKGAVDTINTVKRYTRKNGERFIAKATVSAVRDTEGNEVYRVTIWEDITQQMEAESKLIASESRLSSLVSNLHSAVLLEDQHRHIALVNPKFCELFQIPAPPEALIGSDCSDAAEQSKHHFKDPEGFVSRISEILKARELVLGDELEMTDGTLLERDYIPIFSQGEYQGHLWTYSDVTLSKNYKRNLEREREKYSSIIANMNLGLLEVDRDDVILLTNQSFCTMSGYSATELIGKKASQFLNVKEPEIVSQKTALREEGISDSYELEVRAKDGSSRYWLVSGGPSYNEAGQVIGSIGIHLDITDKKRLELQKEELLSELKTSNQELQEYAHIVSHDLKSPLRSISALATWLQEDFGETLGSEGTLQLEMMQEKIEGMDKLIDGILKYSSIRDDQRQWVSVDLNQVVEEIREIIFIPEHIKIVIMNELPELKADPTQMHQLFQNLISNAVTHIDKEEGLVKISSEETETYWKFQIEDNGVGIAKEYHEKIFQVFQSLDSKEKSTGIGLSIVKKIVDLYEGDIWLESEPGSGTCFYFTLIKQ